MAELINVVTKSAIKTIRRETPIEGAWVDFFTDITASDKEKISSAGEDVGYMVAVCMISDWNFANEAQEKINISIEGVKLLPVKLQQWLAETANEIIMDGVTEKKS